MEHTSYHHTVEDIQEERIRTMAVQAVEEDDIPDVVPAVVVVIVAVAY